MTEWPTGPSCMKSCQDRLKLEELYNCWNKSESRDQELEVDRCHGVNTGAGQVSKGKSPVAQLRWTVLGERHQKRELKQDLIYQKRDLMRVKLLWQCETGSAVVSKGPKHICSLKIFLFIFLVVGIGLYSVTEGTTHFGGSSVHLW